MVVPDLMFVEVTLDQNPDLFIFEFHDACLRCMAYVSLMSSAEKSRHIAGDLGLDHRIGHSGKSLSLQKPLFLRAEALLPLQRQLGSLRHDRGRDLPHCFDRMSFTISDSSPQTSRATSRGNFPS